MKTKVTQTEVGVFIQLIHIRKNLNIIDGYFLNDEENIYVKSMANLIVNCQTLSPFLTKKKKTNPKNMLSNIVLEILTDLLRYEVK